MRSEDKVKVHILEHDIHFKEKVKGMEASSRMEICNKRARKYLRLFCI